MTGALLLGIVLAASAGEHGPTGPPGRKVVVLADGSRLAVVSAEVRGPLVVLVGVDGQAYSLRAQRVVRVQEGPSDDGNRATPVLGTIEAPQARILGDGRVSAASWPGAAVGLALPVLSDHLPGPWLVRREVPEICWRAGRVVLDYGARTLFQNGPVLAQPWTHP